MWVWALRVRNNYALMTRLLGGGRLGAGDVVRWICVRGFPLSWSRDGEGTASWLRRTEPADARRVGCGCGDLVLDRSLPGQFDRPNVGGVSGLRSAGSSGVETFGCRQDATRVSPERSRYNATHSALERTQPVGWTLELSGRFGGSRLGSREPPRANSTLDE